MEASTSTAEAVSEALVLYVRPPLYALETTIPEVLLRKPLPYKCGIPHIPSQLTLFLSPFYPSI